MHSVSYGSFDITVHAFAGGDSGSFDFVVLFFLDIKGDTLQIFFRIL